MQKKYARIAFGILTGLFGAIAVGQWPKYASAIQMLLYTVLVLGLMLISFWSDRGRARFWRAIGLVLLLHFALLFSIRSLFPFRTILVIIPIAIVEAIFASTLFLKTVGY